MKNEFRNYFYSKSRLEEAKFKALIMTACAWDAHKWGNKLQGKSLLTELERKEIADIEKMLRVCADLGWTVPQYVARTQPGYTLLKHEVEVFTKYADFGPDKVFTAQGEPHRQGVEL